MLTITMDSPMALLYSMISGRNPMVIIVVPNPNALCTQAPASITAMTYRTVKAVIPFSFQNPELTVLSVPVLY